MKSVAHSKKNPRNQLPILCAQCRSYHQVKDYPARAVCTCLREYAIHRDSFPLIENLLNAGTDLVKSREARNGLKTIVAREEQRMREEVAYRAFRGRLYRSFENGEGRRRDLDIADAVLGEDGRRRNVEQIAAKWRVPLDHVKGLRDRLLKELERSTSTMPVRSRRAA